MRSTETTTGELQRRIERSRIQRAESLTPLERLRLGADLYDEGMRWLALAISGENPDFTPEQVDAEIERRKAIVRRIDENGYFQDCGIIETDAENQL